MLKSRYFIYERLRNQGIGNVSFLTMSLLG